MIDQVKCAKCYAVQPREAIGWRYFSNHYGWDIPGIEEGYIPLCSICQKDVQLVLNAAVAKFIQPERSKREDSPEWRMDTPINKIYKSHDKFENPFQIGEMRCSEHERKPREG